MTRARRFERPGRSPQRLTQWIGPADQSYLAVASAGETIISSFAAEEALTITRSRGQLSIIPSVFSADVEITGAYGEGVVSAEAFAAGVVSLPSPFRDADWGGWLLWRAFSYRFEFADATGVDFPNWTMELDSKAQRRMGPNEVLVAVAESQSGAFRVSAPLRTLIKLS